jgi:filamentous hemagglutinin family protein
MRNNLLPVVGISFGAISCSLSFLALPLPAQVLPDRTTATSVNGNQINPIGAGTVNGNNLFHSFDQFNVPASGVIFGTNGSSVDGNSIQNILNRVTGGDPSSIFGAIESRGAFPNANLYLLNPNGIIFGAGASLDIGGSFHASTATSLLFDSNQIFSAITDAVFPFGNPQALQFGITKPAAILNAGNLSVGQGQNLTLTGGSVISSGNLNAGGTVAIAAVPGNSAVELRSPNAVLGLTILPNTVGNEWQGTIADIPQLARQLTGNQHNSTEAEQVVLNPDGSLALVPQTAATGLNTSVTPEGKFAITGNYAIAAGDVAIKHITAGTLRVEAEQN